MNNHYYDILCRIDQKPLWFDENAVPRYCGFSPDELANIYADECCLALIQCQNCRAQFRVAFSISFSERLTEKLDLEDKVIQRAIESRSLHYGDPPNIQCCAAGPSMNSDMLAILEYWSEEDYTWKRNGVFEVVFVDGVRNG